MENDIVNRSEFFTALLKEIDSFDGEMFPPSEDRDSDEKVLGETSPWLRKVYSLARFYGREADRLKVEAKYDKDTRGLGARWSEMKMKREVLQSIFWYGANCEMQGWAIGSLGVRTGWQLVEAKADPTDKLRALFGGMFEI